MICYHQPAAEMPRIPSAPITLPHLINKLFPWSLHKSKTTDSCREVLEVGWGGVIHCWRLEIRWLKSFKRRTLIMNSLIKWIRPIALSHNIQLEMLWESTWNFRVTSWFFFQIFIWRYEGNDHFQLLLQATIQSFLREGSFTGLSLWNIITTVLEMRQAPSPYRVWSLQTVEKFGFRLLSFYPPLKRASRHSTRCEPLRLWTDSSCLTRTQFRSDSKLT